VQHEAHPVLKNTIWKRSWTVSFSFGDRTMAVGRVSVAPEMMRLEGRDRIVPRESIRPVDPSSRSAFWAPVAALYNIIMTGADVLAEAHRLRREAERRYPHINFDT
jgi:hypothetical protein